MGGGGGAWFRSRIQENVINQREPLGISRNYENHEKYGMQCHALHAYVLAPGRKHMKFLVCSTPLTS